jgi:uncharacterized protein YhjY with autotransporter beta-barrel domain
VWTAGAVDFGLHRNTAGQSGFHFTTSGLSAGADYRVSDKLTLGAGAGYAHDQSKVGDDGSKVTGEDYVGAVYGDYRPGKNAFVDAVIGYGALSFDSRRWVAADGTYAEGSRHGSQTFASIAAGYDYRDGPLWISTFGRLDALRGSLDGYVETEPGGGTGALSFERQTLSTLTSTLGIHGAYATRTSAGLWSPHWRVEYKHDFQGAGRAALQYADALDGPFYSRAADASIQDRYLVGVGTDLKVDAMSFSLDYQVSGDGHLEIAHQLTGKFALRF